MRLGLKLINKKATILFNVSAACTKMYISINNFYIGNLNIIKFARHIHKHVTSSSIRLITLRVT